MRTVLLILVVSALFLLVLAEHQLLGIYDRIVFVLEYGLVASPVLAEYLAHLEDAWRTPQKT